MELIQVTPEPPK